jgi:hypothetical protein
VGVSHNAAYNHFAHRDDLIAVISEITMRWLVESLQERMSAVHGFSVLATKGPLRDLPQSERDALLEQLLAAIDRSYAATTGSVISADILRPKDATS